MKVIDAKKSWIVKCLAGHVHFYPKDKNEKFGPNKGWDFNGNFEKPGFTPSLREWTPEAEHRPFWQCHFTLTDGIISMCGDCTHEFSGKSGPLPEFTQQEVEHYLSPKNDY